MLVGGLVGLAVGGLLAGLALWAPFLLAAVGMPLLAWPTLRWLPVADPGLAKRRAVRPLRYYMRAMIRPGVRSMLAAEILWVIGYAALPVFFILYAKDVLGLEAGIASLWLAAFALAAGLTMLAAGRIRNPRLHKPFLALGVGLMGLGSPGRRSFDEPRLGLGGNCRHGSGLRTRLDARLLALRLADTPWRVRRLHGPLLLAARRRFGDCGSDGWIDDRPERQLPLPLPLRRRGDARCARAARLRPEPPSRSRSDAASALTLVPDPLRRSAGTSAEWRTSAKSLQKGRFAAVAETAA